MNVTEIETLGNYERYYVTTDNGGGVGFILRVQAGIEYSFVQDLIPETIIENL